jgi:hypothetical protein
MCHRDLERLREGPTLETDDSDDVEDRPGDQLVVN